MANLSDLYNFKKIMSYLESNNGENTKHKEADTGETAMGTYGFMPSTIDDLAKAETTNLDKYMRSISPKDKEVVLRERPDIEDKYATQLSEIVLDKAKGDPNLAAVGWRHGQNLGINSLKEKMTPGYQDRIDEAILNQHLQSKEPTYIEKILARQPKLYKLQSIMPKK